MHQRKEAAKTGHEEHVADRGYNSVRLPIAIPKAMRILEAKVAVDKEWDKQ